MEDFRSFIILVHQNLTVKATKLDFKFEIKKWKQTPWWFIEHNTSYFLLHFESYFVVLINFYLNGVNSWFKIMCTKHLKTPMTSKIIILIQFHNNNNLWAYLLTKLFYKTVFDLQIDELDQLCRMTTQPYIFIKQDDPELSKNTFRHYSWIHKNSKCHIYNVQITRYSCSPHFILNSNFA